MSHVRTQIRDQLVTLLLGQCVDVELGLLAEHVQVADDAQRPAGAPQAAQPLFDDEGLPVAHRIRHVVPAVVYERVAAVRAYDEWVTGDHVPLERLHQLRITAKAMRYTLEFFQEVLGSQAKPLIEEVKGLQDHLGDMQDAVVTCGVLQHFLAWGDWAVPEGEHQPKRPRTPVFVVSPGVAAYLADRQRELETLILTFPERWERIDGPDFVKKVAGAVSVL